MLRRLAGRAPSEVSSADLRPLTEKDLVLLFKQGESVAYGEIYQRYRPMVQRITRRLLKNPDDAEEATQEAMLRVFQGLPRFNGRYLLQAWVARIATNVCLDVIRGRARASRSVDYAPDLFAQGPEELQASRDRDPSQIAEDNMERERIQAVLAALPDTHRVALVLREFEGMSHEDIATVMGTTAPRVKALIHRAKGSFRRAWEGQGVGLLAPILLFPLRIPRILRRMIQPGSSAGQAASSPAMIAATPAVVERATAVVTALVVGTLGFTSLHDLHRKIVPRAPQAAVAAEAPAAGGATIAIAKKHKIKAKAAQAKKQHQEHTSLPSSSPTPQPDDATSPTPEPSPSDSPTPDPTDSPTPDPTESPSPSPSPSPSESPSASPSPTPTAPAWGTEVSSSVVSSSSCGCGPGYSLLSSSVRGTTNDQLNFDQVVSGPAYDVQRDPAWSLGLHYWGDMNPTAGAVAYRFGLEDGGVTLRYGGMARRVSAQSLSDGSTRYTFTGPYYLLDESSWQQGFPRTGTMQVTVEFWKDGATLYKSRFLLEEG